MSGSKLDMSMLKVRRAQHADFKAVMNLNTNVFGGHDYLPTNYHAFIRNKHVVNFVGEINEEVVAYKAFFLDGPKEAVAMGSRVKQSYEGTSVFGEVSKLATEEIRKICPQLEHITWCSLDNMFYHDEEKMKKFNCTLITRFHACIWETNTIMITDFVNANARTGTCFPVLNPTQDQAIKLILDPQNHLRLFPTGYIIGYYNSLPRLITPENVRAFVQSHYVTISLESHSRIAAISYCAINLVSTGNIFNFTFMGDNLCKSTLLHHFLDQARQAVNVTSQNGNINVGILCPLDIDITDIRNELILYCGNPKSDDGFEMERGILAGEWLKPISRM